MKNRIWIIISLFILFLSGCSTKEYELLNSKYISSDLSEDNEVDIIFENKIAIHDRLAIEVYNLDEATNDSFSLDENGIPSDTPSTQKHSSMLPTYGKKGFLVNAQGCVILPHIGSVRLKGLTISQAIQKLTKLYKKYIKNPYVTVELLNQRVFVLGEVKKVSVIPISNETMTIFEVLARSGGLTDFADRKNIKILRNINGKYRLTSVDLTNYLSLSLPQNIILKRNDVVYVPPRSIKAVNVGIKQVKPILDIISTTISTYASIKYIFKD